MRKFCLFAAAAVMSLIFPGAAGEASAGMKFKGSAGFSGLSSSTAYGTSKTVIIIKDSSGQETVVVNESPLIITDHHRRGPMPRDRHHGKRHGGRHPGRGQSGGQPGRGSGR